MNENCLIFMTSSLSSKHYHIVKKIRFGNQILWSYNRKSFQSNKHKKVTNHVLTDVNLHSLCKSLSLPPMQKSIESI